jgi:hypothetical protein
MGLKGMIRDIIMVFVAIKLLTNDSSNFHLALILLATAGFFTVLGFYKLFKGG